MLGPTVAGQFAALQGPATAIAAGAIAAGAVYFADGSAATPSISFASAPTTGFYYGSSAINVAMAGVQKFSLNGGGDLKTSGYMSIGFGSTYWNPTGSGQSQFLALNGVDAAVVTHGSLVSSPGAGFTGDRGISNSICTNAGAAAEYTYTAPASCAIGFGVTLVDVGGTGGISFIAASGESVQIGLLVTSGAARKVKTVSGTGSVVSLVKATATLWIATYSTGTWVGS